MPDDWPSHRQELTRKAAEVLAQGTTSFEAADLNRDEYLVLVTTLYDTTSGLVDRDLSTLIANIHKELCHAV